MHAKISSQIKYLNHNDELQFMDVTVTDARTVDLPSFDEIGFELVTHDSKLINYNHHDLSVNFWDPSKIRDTYYNELNEFLMERYQADIVFTAHHNMRYSGNMDDDIAKQRHVNAKHTSGVHTDFIPQMESRLLNFVQQLVNETDHGINYVKIKRSQRSYEQFDVSKCRSAIYHTWRNLGSKNPKSQFALLDPRSIDQSRKVESSWRNETPNLTINGKAHAENHTIEYFRAVDNDPGDWYYFSNMVPSDLLIFKGWDSKYYYEGQTAYTVGHSGFSLPQEHLSPRWSTDGRTGLIWLP